MLGSGFFGSLFKKNRAPEWFCQDVKSGVSEDEIKQKIRAEIYHEIEHRKYDRELWNDAFVSKTAVLYYKFFDQLYMQSA